MSIWLVEIWCVWCVSLCWLGFLLLMVGVFVLGVGVVMVVFSMVDGLLLRLFFYFDL